MDEQTLKDIKIAAIVLLVLLVIGLLTWYIVDQSKHSGKKGGPGPHPKDYGDSSPSEKELLDKISTQEMYNNSCNCGC
jgi:hypothetical protein